MGYRTPYSTNSNNNDKDIDVTGRLLFQIDWGSFPRLKLHIHTISCSDSELGPTRKSGNRPPKKIVAIAIVIVIVMIVTVITPNSYAQSTY